VAAPPTICYVKSSSDVDVWELGNGDGGLHKLLHNAFRRLRAGVL
jgi:hypothetical protein